jgi:hypothetical protein
LYSAASTASRRPFPSGVSADQIQSRQLRQEESEERVGTRTRRRNELLVQIVRKQRYRQRPEVVLHARRNGGKVIELVAVLEVELLPSLEVLSDEFRLTHAARFAVDAFVGRTCTSKRIPISSAPRTKDSEGKNGRKRRRTVSLDSIDTLRHDDRNVPPFRRRLSDEVVPEHGRTARGEVEGVVGLRGRVVAAGVAPVGEVAGAFGVGVGAASCRRRERKRVVS